MTEVDCRLQDIAGVPTDKTVGDLMDLVCEGDFSSPLSEKSALRFAEPELKYALKIVKVEKSSSGDFYAKVTSYLPGNHQDKSFEIYDSDNLEAVYLVKGLSWSYNSVLEQAEALQKEILDPPPEKLEAFPFQGPLAHAYPLWVWLGLAIALSAVGLVALRWQKKRRQKQRLLEKSLSGLGSALSPFQNFNKQLRQIMRRAGRPEADMKVLMPELERAFRIYLAESFLVPALDWTDAEILQDIKSQHRKVYTDSGLKIRKLLREFREIRLENLNRHDFEQLLELSRGLVETLDRLREGKNRRRGVVA